MQDDTVMISDKQGNRWAVPVLFRLGDLCVTQIVNDQNRTLFGYTITHAPSGYQIPAWTDESGECYGFNTLEHAVQFVKLLSLHLPENYAVQSDGKWHGTVESRRALLRVRDLFF